MKQKHNGSVDQRRADQSPGVSPLSLADSPTDHPIQEIWPEPFQECQQVLQQDKILPSGINETTAIYLRRDVMNTHSSLLAKKRALKPGVNMKTERILQRECNTNCIFHPDTYEKVTPGARIIHPNGAISVPNLYEFLPRHRVSAHPAFHPGSIHEITAEHIKALLFASRELACGAGSGIFIDGINFGELAAPSQWHWHSQQGELPLGTVCVSERERVGAEMLALKMGCDAYGFYIRAVQKTPLLIWADAIVTIASAFAPVYPDQIDIWLNEDIADYSELHDGALDGASVAIARALKGLASVRSVEDFNVVAHQAALGGGSRYPRLHWHIFPRSRRRDGFAEQGHQLCVCDVFPEFTASAIRPFFG